MEHVIRHIQRNSKDNAASNSARLNLCYYGGRASAISCKLAAAALRLSGETAKGCPAMGQLVVF